jgi:hypothetical protein
MSERYIQLQFMCIPDGGIPICERTDVRKGEEPQTVVYVYHDEGAGWEPTFRHKIILPMFDSAPAGFLKSHEYRVWNEHVISKLTRGLRGEGVLTLAHRLQQDWYMGLAWSTHPLRCVCNARHTPPLWWGAEDLWAEVDGFYQLERKVLAELERQHDRFQREAAERRIRDQEDPPPPRPRDPDPGRFRRQLEAALRDALRED